MNLFNLQQILKANKLVDCILKKSELKLVLNDNVDQKIIFGYKVVGVINVESIEVEFL